MGLFWFVMAVVAVLCVISGIYSALEWFAAEAERQCAKRRHRYFK